MAYPGFAQLAPWMVPCQLRGGALCFLVVWWQGAPMRPPHTAEGPLRGAAPPDCCKFVTSSNAISPLIAALGAELQGYKLQDKLKSLSLQGQWEKLIIFMGPDRAWTIRMPQPWSWPHRHHPLLPLSGVPGLGFPRWPCSSRPAPHSSC